MLLKYLSVIIFVIVAILINMVSSKSEAKIKNIHRRDKGLKLATDAGYTISKRWDCNALTIFIDEKKKILGFLTMAWRKDIVHYIPIKEITNVDIESIGVIKKSKIKSLITQICLNINTTHGNYVLRTLIIKGIGIRKNSPSVLTAIKNSEEICESIKKLQK